MARLARIIFGAAVFFCAHGCLATTGGEPLGLTEARDAGASPDSALSASEACAASDLDGDGYGTDPSCGELRDCDDTNLSIHPGAPEACNGIDDNCDGQIDEDLGETSCGLGACLRTVPNCTGGHPTVCVAGDPQPEMCNGIDDDCNGAIDDEVSNVTCGTGACARAATCENGMPAQCVPGDPQPESCNRIDDNCDGTVDEGFRAHVVNGTYSMLVGFHASCDGSGERMGPDCNAAINRFCASDGCTTAGFGPLENSGDISIIGCVAAEPGRDVPYATLATFDPSCDGSAQRMGPECNAAMHRYCASLGYASGFGPGESGADSALVTCLRAGAATAVPTTYTVLATYHDGCSGVGEGRYGPACNAAINRFCAGTGYTTGFGPVENAGDGATVVCISP